MQTLQAEQRESLQKSYMNEQRSLGKVPAVVYGRNIDSTSIFVEEAELIKLIRDHGSNVLVQLKWGSGSSTVMIVDVQKNPLKEQVVHVDFQEINLKQKTIVEVPIEWVGEEAVMKDKAVLQKQAHVLEVETLPADIPERIQIDVSKMEIGDQLTIADVQVEGNFELVADQETVIVSVLPPTLETDPEEPQIDEEAEPALVEGEEESTDKAEEKEENE
ncbi:50S ribosomal protein L25/general stress protein Ctc [Bacillus horti]|uniref:Large ribosomal subunit protein bL25 n=1 Tax=Caldalkalibacillus horti TaxID=77523 RepID=A0ABT9W3Z8_9BACI|nr:50S ribosomal protein L25/general stress protein Ctc [Bacillus horti]MDQ0167580.1 large subunit ribosomal protein L25 [Bacillus horti]